MTSFGASKVISEVGFMPTFTVQGQIYHKIGSILPSTENDSKFLQIYFIGDKDIETDKRCSISCGTKREIVANVQKLLHEHNDLIKLFKYALEQMPTNDYKVIIRADNTPNGEHERRFNAPTVADVAIVMVGIEFEGRDIIIDKRNVGLQRLTKTHRFYDALQYPLLFWKGEERYHFKIMQTDHSTRD